ATFLNDPSPSKQLVLDASWHSERLFTLLWALQLVQMPPFVEQCDTSKFLELLPPYADVNEREFVHSASLRSESDLLAMADEIMDRHWEARDAKLKGYNAEQVDIEIVQERHHAINWVIGYDGLPWDEVTTDT